MVYDVSLWANAPYCDLPGYTQFYLVQYDDEHIISLQWKLNEGVVPCEQRIKVMSKYVKAPDPFSALVKFREWENNGKHEDWLME